MSQSFPFLMRPAHACEAAEIAGMSRLMIEHGLRWRWTAGRVRQAIRDPETMVLIASRDGDIAGFAIMKFGDEEAHLHLLAVRPADRRRGIATALLAWLEKSARTAALGRIRLEVRAGNAPARSFYRRLGYRYLGQLPGYYDRVEAAAVFAKSLMGESARAADP